MACATDSVAVGRDGLRGRSGVDNRLFVDAILWMAGNAARWRDLPEVFGKWSGVPARFRRWSRAGVWEKLLQAMADTPDFEYVLLIAVLPGDFLPSTASFARTVPVS